MPFRDLVGHRHVIDLLARAVGRDTLPPSLIFSGPEGVGKRRVALTLAQAVNCLRRPNVRTSERPTSERQSSTVGRSDERLVGSSDARTPVDSCGHCAACRRIAKGVHPDVMVVDEKGVHPEVLDVEVKDTSAIIPIDVARKVIKVAGFRPYEARGRFVIFDPADAMERPAQNALLKVLEETPATTVFVLVTARPDALYATIRSRCPQIRFGPLTVADIAAVLRRERGLGEPEARAAAIVAGGSVARALESISEDTTDARGRALVLLHEAASVREPSRLLEQMKDAMGLEKRAGATTPAAEREQLTLSLRALSSLLRDVTVLEARGASADLANADLQHDLQRVARSFGRERVMRAFAAVDHALYALGANVNAKLVLDWLAFEM
jgi:DNA polymerase-3 subunit delta'